MKITQLEAQVRNHFILNHELHTEVINRCIATLLGDFVTAVCLSRIQRLTHQHLELRADMRITPAAMFDFVVLSQDFLVVLGTLGYILLKLLLHRG